jgi:hypothetical protein
MQRGRRKASVGPRGPHPTVGLVPAYCVRARPFISLAKTSFMTWKTAVLSMNDPSQP